MTQTELLYRSDLDAMVSEQTNLPPAQTRRTIDALLKIIYENLVDGKGVRISPVGVIHVTKRAERNGRNPRTGESITIPATYHATLKNSSKLKRAFKEK